MRSITATIAAISLMEAAAFAPNSHGSRISSMQLNGLFDGMKDAFGAPALERSTLDTERETPIDRWMGWNVQPETEQMAVAEGMCDALLLLLISACHRPTDLIKSSFSYYLSTQ